MPAQSDADVVTTFPWLHRIYYQLKGRSHESWQTTATKQLVQIYIFYYPLFGRHELEPAKLSDAQP